MNLKSHAYKVIAIKKKTKAKWWADLRVGSLVHFHMDLKKKHNYSGHRNATFITCVHQDTMTTFVYSQTEVINYLDKFELAVIPFQGNITTSV